MPREPEVRTLWLCHSQKRYTPGHAATASVAAFAQISPCQPARHEQKKLATRVHTSTAVARDRHQEEEDRFGGLGVKTHGRT